VSGAAVDSTGSDVEMDIPDDQLDKRHQKAVSECKDYIRWYGRHKHYQRIGHWASILAIGLFSLAGTIIGAFEDVPAIWRILPAALTTFIAFLIGHFRWHSEWIRFSMASQALMSELFKFETAATPDYADDVCRAKRIANFANRVDAIIQNEAAEWKALVSQSTGRSSQGS
jgi:hypothetical protein